MSESVFPTLMVIAMVGAWEGGRLAGGPVSMRSAARMPLAVIGLSTVPGVISGVAGHLVATMISLSHAGIVPPLPSPLLYLGFVLVAWGVATVSWLVGYALDTVISLPLMAGAVYLGMIWPLLTGDIAFRSLLAEHSSCCSISQQVDWRGVLAPILFGIGLAVCGSAIAVWTWRPHRWSGLVAAFAVLVLGVGLVLPTFIANRDQVQARDARALVCRQSASSVRTYCVWPEQSGDLDAFIREGDTTLDAWARLGLPFAPATVTTAMSTGGVPDAVSVSFGPDPTQGHIALALATALLPEPYTCQGNVAGSYVSLMLWMALAGGASSDDRALAQFTMPGNPSGGPLVTAQDRLAQSADAQGAWFAQEYAQMLAGCA
ncbi:MAG: hypothetical protein QM589_11045 [Thermomicrobiales bacterium]